MKMLIMKKDEIVDIFLDAGFLISSDALDFLAAADKTDDDIKAMITKIKDKTSPEKLPEKAVIMLSDIKQPDAGEGADKGTSEAKDESKDEIKIIKNITKKLDEIKTEDFLHFYQDKYKKMQKIIQGKIKANFVSINKLGGLRKEVTVIGIVKDKKEKEEKQVLELEDMTGAVPVVFSSGVVDTASVDLDDVIAVRGISATRVIYGKEIIYPDIPLRSASSGSGKACFISDLHLNEAPTTDIKKFFKWFSQSDIKYLFVAGDIVDMAAFEKFIEEFNGRKTFVIIPGNMDNNEYPALPIKIHEKGEKRNIVSLSNPAMVELNNIKILLVHDFNLSMLKKRYLGKSKDILEEDYLVLDEVPDIVHCGHTHEPFVRNYKSVTIVNSGSPLTEFRPVVVDFNTRAVEQVKI